MAANRISIGFAQPDDIPSWMELVELVRSDFPGLETEERLAGYQQTVVDAINRRTAICAKDGDKDTEQSSYDNLVIDLVKGMEIKEKDCLFEEKNKFDYKGI